jgi:hypothetical protein
MFWLSVFADPWPQEAVMRSVNPNGKRRQGAQPGNTSRLIHGRYSRPLPRHVTANPNPRTSDDPEFELVMARLHLIQLLTAEWSSPPRLWPSYERAIIDCLCLIVSLISGGVRRTRNRPEMDRILADLRHDATADFYVVERDPNLIGICPNVRSDLP